MYPLDALLLRLLLYSRSGRNVCLYWLLLDECKNGNACAYAHDKTYLPTSGWWTNEKRLNRIRERYARITAVTGRPCPPEFYIREMNIKPFGYELWALVPYEPTTEERKAWERRGNWHADSYVLAEMAFYEINPKRRDALVRIRSLVPIPERIGLAYEKWLDHVNPGERGFVRGLP